MEELVKQLEAEGYDRIEERNGILIGIMRFMFTWGLVVGLDAIGYDRRYCYKTLPEVLEAMKNWDLSKDQHPSGNWIKCKGSCGDIMNPNYVAPTIEELIIK